MKSLYYKILYILFPYWVIAAHNEELMHIKCRAWIAKARLYFRTKTLNKKIIELEGKLFNAQNSSKCWNSSWHDQRIKTGESYWQGYADGKYVAIKWHLSEAEKKKTNTTLDKHSAEFDAIYHKFSADSIKQQGRDVNFKK